MRGIGGEWETDQMKQHRTYLDIPCETHVGSWVTGDENFLLRDFKCFYHHHRHHLALVAVAPQSTVHSTII
eukprot:scaffold90767_cov63-Cyclotella_meneghiniana.AAC.5